MVFEVNGYRLSSLTKNVVAVQQSLANLAAVLTDARNHMTHLGEPALASTLQDLADRLETDQQAIDDAFEQDLLAVSQLVTDRCIEAAGPGGMRTRNDHSALYEALTWSMADLCVVRIGGYGTIEHPGGS